MMKKTVFSGVCTALVTPFQNNKVNYPLIDQMLEFQINSGVKAVVLSGTTGESPTLSDKEKINIFKHAKSFSSNRIPIIAGTGTNSTEHAINLSKAAEDVGVDALLIVSPYYNKGNHDGLFRHFLAIAESVRIPIILYNVPSRTGIDIPVSVYKKLSAIPNIVGVKEASTDIRKITKIRSACGDDFNIWTGNDDQIVPTVSLGGKGVISVVSNLLPAETVVMTNAALSGDFVTASAIQCKLNYINCLLFKEVNPIPVKYAMKCIGFDCGRCRLPLGDPDPETIKKIDEYFH